MKILNPPLAGEIYQTVNRLHKDLPDEKIREAYSHLAEEKGYCVVSSRIDRANGVAPSLHVQVHPKGKSTQVRNFTILLLANTANVGVVFPYEGENYLLVRVQDKAGYLSAVSVPGGHAELFDSNIEDTAKRELLEEVNGIHIPKGSKFWVGECTSVSLCNNATNTDTESMIWIKSCDTDAFVQSIDWGKWNAVKVMDAPRVLTHGSSKPVGLTAALFESGAGDCLSGTYGTL